MLLSISFLLLPYYFHRPKAMFWGGVVCFTVKKNCDRIKLVRKPVARMNLERYTVNAIETSLFLH